ncbi:hypothetical protein EHI42_28470 [Rhizobium hidalgonense]|nr:hypothetical protein [Rhizobium hidalgonense]RWX08549.1 hypothetical protein EHI42_28470 [Rhizobium hidalgonense]
MTYRPETQRRDWRCRRFRLGRLAVRPLQTLFAVERQAEPAEQAVAILKRNACAELVVERVEIDGRVDELGLRRVDNGPEAAKGLPAWRLSE